MSYIAIALINMPFKIVELILLKRIGTYIKLHITNMAVIKKSSVDLCMYTLKRL